MRTLFQKIFPILLIIVVLFVSSCSSGNDISQSLDPDLPFTSTTAVAHAGDITEEVRGVWIASVYNINFPSAPDLPEEDLKSELDSIVDTVISHNMNTVFFQVHPASDALYRSDLFPVSEYLYSDGILHFDPLKYMSEICRKNGISLFAWINPLRISVSAAESADEAKSLLPIGSPGYDDDLTVFYGDGKLYLNCGNSDVRELVASAVDEIMSGYDIDGIVFDDYFYPYPAYDSAGNLCEFDDSLTFENSDTALTLEDWRRDNVNQMIKLCYDKVKSYGADKKIGVAPFGIWQNNDGQNGGSDTAGMEAYHELYCDASAWIKGRYVDFISPQLYWKCSSADAPFGELAEFWSSLTDGTGVELIISHGIYRYDSDWDDPAGELIEQINVARKNISYKGSILYGYAALEANVSGAADDTLTAFSDTVYYYSPADYPDGIVIEPTEKIDDSAMTVTFSGFSDPASPLSVNGQTVSRMQGGYFECILSLKNGENSFTFVCGENSHTVTVIKN